MRVGGRQSPAHLGLNPAATRTLWNVRRWVYLPGLVTSSGKQAREWGFHRPVRKGRIKSSPARSRRLARSEHREVLITLRTTWRIVIRVITRSYVLRRTHSLIPTQSHPWNTQIFGLTEVKPVNPKERQPWIFIRRTDAEAEAPIPWLPDAKS